MHIHALHIDGFGIFNDFELSGFDQGINLVVGANEAGKSTLLQFFRYTLFGYPRSVDERMAPLRGGNHGGRITAQLHDGKKVTFERMSGASGGNIRLVYPNRESTSQNEWNQLLGQASPQMYENIYAFTLDELVGFDKLRESGIRDRLFSVQLGLGEVSLNEISSNLENEAMEIYKSKTASKQLIPRIKHELEANRVRLKELQGKREEYEQLKSELAGLAEEIGIEEETLRKLKQKVEKRNQLLQCYGNYYDLVEVRQKLAGAPESQGLDGAQKDEMDELLRERKNVKNAVEELEAKKIRKVEELQGIELDEDLLEKEREIKWLENHLEKYKSDVSAAGKLRDEIADAQSRTGQELQEIGGGWTEERVRAFEGFDQKLARVEQFARKYEELKERRTRLEGARDSSPASAAIDTKKVFIGLAVLALVVGAGLLVSQWTVLGILLLVVALGFLGYALFGLKKAGTRVSQDNPFMRLEAEQAKTDQDYAELMQSLYLATTLEPGTAKELLRKIRDLQERLVTIEKRKGELKGLEASIAGFEENLNAVTGSAENVEVAVSQMTDQLKQEQQKQAQIRNLEELISGYKEDMEDRKLKLKQTQAAVDELLGKLDVPSPEAFYDKLNTDLQVQEWQQAEQEFLKQIAYVVGREKTDGVIEYLGNHDKMEIEGERNQLEKEQQELEERLRAHYDHRVQIQTALSNLEEVESLSEVLTEIHALKNQLRDAYKEWLTNQVALQMLEKEKKRFEKEKQPEVIRLSEQHFARITKGRYPRIQMPLGGEDVIIYDAQERPKRTHELSRGTREQLLISLRMGFIEEYEKTAEPLPVVMDEILVNFDPARTRETTEILADFASERQLLFFTCHPSTEQFFEGLDYNLIKLDGGNKEGSTLFG